MSEITGDALLLVQNCVSDASEVLHAWMMHSLQAADTLMVADPELEFPRRQLAVSLHLSTESTLILISQGKIWDSETVARSVFEGTVKYLFLRCGTPSDQRQRVQEFWEDFPNISRIKRHERAKAFLTTVEGDATHYWQPIRDNLLPDDEVVQLRADYPRPRRQQLEQRWACAELLRLLSRETSTPLAFKDLDKLLYFYGMASHVVHQDGDAVAMIFERSKREDDRRVLLAMSHAGRIISDMLTLARLRYVMIHACAGIDVPNIPSVQPLLNRISGAMGDIADEWHRREYPHLHPQSELKQS